MIITHKIEIDLALRGPNQMVPVVQDDKYTRNVEITLLCNAVAWTPPEGATGVVRYRKPDGTGGNYDLLPDDTAAVSIVDNILTVALAPQVCTVPGVVKLAVALISGTKEVNTFVVDIDVQANPGLQVTSEGYYNVRGSLPDSGWTPNKVLGTDTEGNVIEMDAAAGGGGGGASVAEVVAALPATAELDFTEWENGSFVETLADGSTVVHEITFDSSGVPTKIGGITVKGVG